MANFRAVMLLQQNTPQAGPSARLGAHPILGPMSPSVTPGMGWCVSRSRTCWGRQTSTAFSCKQKIPPTHGSGGTSQWGWPRAGGNRRASQQRQGGRSSMGSTASSAFEAQQRGALPTCTMKACGP